MGSWQRDQLADETDIAYLISMHENKWFDTPRPRDMAEWADALSFEADAFLLDPGRDIIDAYVGANPDRRFTEAVTVVIDRNLRIRFVGGTYDTGHERNLTLIEALLDEASSTQTR